MSKTKLYCLILSAALAVWGCPEAPAPEAPELEAEVAAGCTVTFDQGTVDGSQLWTDIPDAANPQNCNFHRFAYNNFLYLIGDDGSGHPRFMSFASWDELFPASGTPVWPGGYTPLNAIEIVKSNTVTLDQVEAGQAGDDFQLVDVNNMTAQYDLRVNEAFFDYVVDNGLYTKSALDTAANDFANNPPSGGIWLPWGSDSEVGAIEFKTSWRAFGTDASACPSDIMYCTQGGEGNTWGLVGMHLVQKTPTRGELVWGSFEHVANSPDCASGGSNPIQQNPTDPTGSGGTINANQNIASLADETGWNFFNYTSYIDGGGDGSTCTFPEDASAPATGKQCNTDPEDGDNFKQVNICRTDQLPPASTSCVDGASNAQNVSCLNQSVQDNFPPGLASMWKYYMEIGAEWMNATSVPTTGCFEFTDSPACPDAPSGTTYPGTTTAYPATFPRTGTTALANTTMETWMQKGMAGLYGTDSKLYEATDCFGCHAPVTKTFGEGDTSHIFTKIQQNGS